jgi:transposase
MKPRAETTAAPLTVIGVDIGKDVFHLVGFGADGKITFRRTIRRLGLKDVFEKLPPCIVGMEACLRAHFVSWALRASGHEPRIIPAVYVKPFVKGQKNDENDAEAIAEAALQLNLRFVQEKIQDQLDLQACHRVRSRLVSRRTATINQIRAFLIEQGIAVRSGPRALRNSLFAILENRKDEISPRTAKLIHGLYDDWCGLDERIETVTQDIEELSQAEPKCQRLMSVPGVGPLISTAVVAAISTGEAFERGRDFAAWLGPCATTVQHRGTIDPGADLQARQQVSAYIVDPGGEGPADAAAQLAPLQLRSVAQGGLGSVAPEQARRRLGQQARPHRLERSAPRQSL